MANASSSIEGGKQASSLSDLARINGTINRLPKSELIHRLSELGLETQGSRDIMKKRLKSFFKAHLVKSGGGAGLNSPHSIDLYEYYIVIDFEATCDANNSHSYMHEIIEFPAVLIKSTDLSVVDEFHSYCKPTRHPELSKFCQELTGITQDLVDNAPTFPEVLKQFQEWLNEKDIGRQHSFIVVTDGPWDMGRFLHMQCQISEIKYPQFAKEWVNIRKIFSQFYSRKRSLFLGCSLNAMLDKLGMHFKGRPHCGIDDARNIARVCIRMLRDGALLRPNEKIDPARANSLHKHNLPVTSITSEEFHQRRKKAAAAAASLQQEEIPEWKKGDDTVCAFEALTLT